jgi:hypothetical protein
MASPVVTVGLLIYFLPVEENKLITLHLLVHCSAKTSPNNIHSIQRHCAPLLKDRESEPPVIKLIAGEVAGAKDESLIPIFVIAIKFISSCPKENYKPTL